jgi:hypothetical protein
VTSEKMGLSDRYVAFALGRWRSMGFLMEKKTSRQLEEIEKQLSDDYERVLEIKWNCGSRKEIKTERGPLVFRKSDEF